MKITLKRFLFLEKQTLGILAYGDNICYALEDAVRGNGEAASVAKWKVYGESAIPYGTYELEKRMSPSKKEPRIYLNSVQGFQGIQIHAGNTDKDTEGCIMPAYCAQLDFEKGKPSLRTYNSAKAVENFYEWFDRQTEKVFLEIRK